jgi:hypothetical protein
VHFKVETTIVISHQYCNDMRATASIPLVDMSGKTSSTPSSIYEAFGVAKLLGLPIKITDPHGNGEAIEVQRKEIRSEN